MQAQPEIKIIPVFDQRQRGIWRDFTRIEMLCDREKYRCNMNTEDENRIYYGHILNWTGQKNNFAFAAYDGVKMIGFASGYLANSSDMYLQNLYVEPKYNGMGIGGHLLEHAENCANLVAKNMTLISLNGAISFYKQHGYINYDNRNMLKKLPLQILGTIPVFKPMGRLNAKIKTEFDKAVVKECKNRPVFVYVSQNREIDGIAVKTKSGENKIWLNGAKRSMHDFYQKQLLRALEKVR